MLPSTMARGGVHPAQKADLFNISETPKLRPVVIFSQEGKNGSEIYAYVSMKVHKWSLKCTVD